MTLPMKLIFFWLVMLMNIAVIGRACFQSAHAASELITISSAYLPAFSSFSFANPTYVGAGQQLIAVTPSCMQSLGQSSIE